MKLVHLTAILALTFGVPLSLQPVFAMADQTIEGCHWSGSNWIYADDSLCRGTGEDPTVDSAGLPACADGCASTINDRVMCIGDTAKNGPLPSNGRRRS